MVIFAPWIIQDLWTGAVDARGYRLRFGRVGNVYPICLTLDSLQTGPSDYDIASDQIHCPCGATLDWDGTVGQAVRLATEHLRKVHGK